MDTRPLADEVEQALASRQAIARAFSGREGGLTLADAYAVQRELSHRRTAAGRRIVGRKIGFANKAVWRALKLDTLVWAPMYDDTVRPADDRPLSLHGLWTPKIEPEIVFTLRQAPTGTADDPAEALAAVARIGLAYEIVDTPFADPATQPVDFVASGGYHVALIVGPSRPVSPDEIPDLVGRLATFTLRLTSEAATIDGGGRNVLRSPALCLAEVGVAVARAAGDAPLRSGDLISTGSLTDPQRIAAGQTWTATVEGLDLPPLRLQTIA